MWIWCDYANFVQAMMYKSNSYAGSKVDMFGWRNHGYILCLDSKGSIGCMFVLMFDSNKIWFATQFEHDWNDWKEGNSISAYWKYDWVLK